MNHIQRARARADIYQRRAKAKAEVARRLEHDQWEEAVHVMTQDVCKITLVYFAIGIVVIVVGLAWIFGGCR